MAKILSKLKENPDNPRTISKDKFEKLKENIVKFPKMLELRPIVYNKKFIALGGNMRLKAIKELQSENKLKVKESYFKKAETLTEQEQKDFIILDNQEFGDWDMDLLANSWDMTELLDLGFDEKDLIGLTFGDSKTEEELDDAPEPKKTAISKLGDLFLLDDRHRVLCGDSTIKEDVEKLMDGKKADIVFTDPPYGMNLDTDYTKMPIARSGAKPIKHKKVIGDNEDFNSDLIMTIFNNFGYCEEIFIWGADYFAEILQNKNNGSWIVWDKRVDEKFDKMFGSCFELCWSKAKHKRMIARFNNTLFSGESDAKNKVHPTQKPIKLILWFYDYYSLQNKILTADLFLGSGSTLIACEQTNRICYGMEIDPIYIDVILRRYHNLYPDKEIKCLNRKDFNFNKLFNV